MTDELISGKDDGDMVADTGVGFIAKLFFCLLEVEYKIFFKNLIFSELRNITDKFCII